MLSNVSIVRTGSTGSGKTLAAARDAVESDGAEVDLDPHKDSLAKECVTHGTGNVLLDVLSSRFSPGYNLLVPSSHPDPEERAHENEQRAEAFVPLIMRRRDKDNMAGTPLMEEWIMAAIMMFLFQKVPKLLTILVFAFMPWTDEFKGLVQGCALPEIRRKFQLLEKMTPRALRSEVGSASRLINSIFRSRAFALRCRGGFDVGAFLQNKGKLIVERGDGVGDDTMRVIMGAIVLQVVEHAKRRPKPYPIIHIRIDEANTAQLVGRPELRGIAETRKNGLFWDFLNQSLDFPGGAEEVLQNCKRHEWYGCSSYELARKAAIDVVAHLRREPYADVSRAERIATITEEIMHMSPGWRWVCDPSGARKEYVPLLQEPWPDWPGLREQKLQEKIQWIYNREEYRRSVETPSLSSSTPESPRPTKSQEDFFAAQALKRRAKKRRDSSAGSGGESASEYEAS